MSQKVVAEDSGVDGKNNVVIETSALDHRRSLMKRMKSNFGMGNDFLLSSN